jgi:hypothetical protein
MTEKFVYLSDEEFIDTWVEGRQLPLRFASWYLRSEQKQGAQFTRSEVRIERSNLPLSEIARLTEGVADFRGMNVEVVAIEDCVDGSGQPLPNMSIQRAGNLDGLVLCFANRLSNYIAYRFGRSFAVRVPDVEALKSVLDQQLGASGLIGSCEYTPDHQADTFLKHIEDCWQDEFRIFWPRTRGTTWGLLPSEQSVMVNLPGNAGERVDIQPSEERSEADEAHERYWRSRPPRRYGGRPEW